jgi:hypothetical protein
VNFAGLLERFGYHIAIVGLLGMLVIELLKVPMNRILNKRFPKVVANAEKFDLVAFLLSFIVAVTFAVVYSLIVSYTNFIRLIGGDNLVGQLSVFGYLTNILGVWLFQGAFYSIYKKLGIKRLLKILFSSIATSIKKFFDANRDGKVDVDEAIAKIQTLLDQKRISGEEIASIAIDIVANSMETVAKETPEIIVDPVAQVEDIKSNLGKVIKKMPPKEVQALVKAAEIAGQKPVEPKLTETSKAKKASIKF